ncbi:hypothetical protein [Streptomyces sp. NPDC127033]|uniref:hypothetical protein n=1 Tax=Streptomyces sp. NPDC127033 TaxID=3347110 RepID=UPI003660FF9A
MVTRGVWTTALPFSGRPWFYVTGVVASACRLRDLVTVLRFPAKEAVDGRRPIW